MPLVPLARRSRTAFAVTSSVMRRRRLTNPFQVGQRVVVIEGQLRGLEGVVIARDPVGRVVIEGVLNRQGLLLRIPFRCVRQVAEGVQSSGEGESV